MQARMKNPAMITPEAILGQSEPIIVTQGGNEVLGLPMDETA